MKKIITFSLILISGIALSACTVGNKTVPTTSTSTANQATQKSGETIKTGKIIQAGGSYFLESGDGQRQKLGSYSVDLSAYVNQSVTITGQFSGDELFVGSVK